MRAQLLGGHGDVDKYTFTEDAKRPIVHDGEVLVRVGACAVNSMDIWAREGVLSANPATGCHPLSFPCIQGSDVVGRIQEVGLNVPRRRVGQRVIVYPVLTGNEDMTDYGFLGMDRNGGFAEFVAVPSSNCIEVPVECELDDTDLASLITSGMTAYRMIMRARIVAGETVVITGASGGTGVALIQLCKARGAKIIAVCSEEKKEDVIGLGATHVVARDATDLSAALVEFGLPIDCVLDVVAGPLLPELFKAMKKNGRYCCGGAVAGPDTTPLFWPLVYLKELELIGSLLASKAEFFTLVDLIVKNVIQPCVHHVFTLEELPEAQACLKEKSFVGKLVIDCALPDPIPKEGEFMLKCEEMPSCIEWSDSGVMKVTRVTDTAALAASMIPESAQIVRGHRLLRVETARGTCLADETLIQKRRGKALKLLFADKPTLFLVFHEVTEESEEELSLISSSSSSSSSSAIASHRGLHKPGRGRARSSKLLSAQQKKRLASPKHSELPTLKPRNPKPLRATQTRLKTVTPRPQRSASPKQRLPARGMTLRTLPPAPPKKKRRATLLPVKKKRPASPVRLKKKRRASPSSSSPEERVNQPQKKQKRRASQSPDRNQNSIPSKQKRKLRAANKSPEEKRHTSPLQQKRKRRVANKSPEEKRRLSPPQQKRKRRAVSESPPQKRHTDHQSQQRRHTSQTVDPKQLRGQQSNQKLRTNQSLEQKRATSPPAKPKRLSSHSPEQKRLTNPLQQKQKQRASQSPVQKRRMSRPQSKKKRRASESPAQKRRTTPPQPKQKPKRYTSHSPAQKRRKSHATQHNWHASQSETEKRRTSLPTHRKQRTSLSPTPKRRTSYSARQKRRVSQSPPQKRRTSQPARYNRRTSRSPTPNRRTSYSAQQERRAKPQFQHNRRATSPFPARQPRRSPREQRRIPEEAWGRSTNSAMYHNASTMVTSPAKKVVRNALDEAADNTPENTKTRRSGNADGSAGSLSPSIAGGRQEMDDSDKMRPPNRGAVGDGSADRRPFVEEGGREGKTSGVRIEMPAKRVELSRRVEPRPVVQKRFSRLSVDRMAGLIGFRRERSRSRRHRVTLVRRKEVERENK
eukprot:GEMP01005750.1.p1 GENE.GEMP01005750.1~~GEMP01005750.1.p1  ORF type:complete len:1091 (+),score=216.66 GEMP01005750.1:210-3482(+)